jgi:hypothetical protein
VLCKKKHNHLKKNQDEASLMTALLLDKELAGKIVATPTLVAVKE